MNMEEPVWEMTGLPLNKSNPQYLLDFYMAQWIITLAAIRRMRSNIYRMHPIINRLIYYLLFRKHT